MRVWNSFFWMCLLWSESVSLENRNQLIDNKECTDIYDLRCYSTTVAVQAAVGSLNVVLPCTATRKYDSNDLLKWLFYSTGDSTAAADTVYMRGRVFNGFVGRFQRIPSSSTTDYSLVVDNVTRDDAGLYVCSEDNGIGPHHAVVLRVSDESVKSAPTLVQTTPNIHHIANSASTPESVHCSHLVTPLTILAVTLLLLIASFLTCALVCMILYRRGWRLKKAKRGSPLAEYGDSIVQPLLHNECACIKQAELDTEQADLKDKCWHELCLDFQKKGSHETTRTKMRDLYELMRFPELRRVFITEITARINYAYRNIDIIVSPDTHGFMFGLLIAEALGKPFVPVRKFRKLPGDTVDVKYSSRNDESGEMCIQCSAIRPGQKVLIIDEKLATGGSLLAAFELLLIVKADICGCFVVFEDKTFRGREQLSAKFPHINVTSLLQTASGSGSGSSSSGS